MGHHSTLEVKPLKFLNMDNMSSAKTLIRICMLAACLIPTVGCQSTCDNSPMCPIDNHSLLQDTLNGTVLYNESLGIFPRFEVIAQKMFFCPNGSKLGVVQSETKKEQLCIPDRASHICPNTASLELLTDPQNGMKLLICRPTNSCRGDGNYYCKVHFSMENEDVVQIEETECQFGYSTNRRLRYMTCKRNTNVAESKKFDDLAYCDLNNGAYNKNGKIYFEKYNENMQQCVYDPSHCFPDNFRPDGSCIKECPPGMTMTEDAGFNCSIVDRDTVNESSTVVQVNNKVSCGEGQFQCTAVVEGQPECIVGTRKCDGHNDCSDNSDERDCRRDENSSSNVLVIVGITGLIVILVVLIIMGWRMHVTNREVKQHPGRTYKTKESRRNTREINIGNHCTVNIINKGDTEDVKPLTDSIQVEEVSEASTAEPAAEEYDMEETTPMKLA